jgi:hypothetical protein
MSLEDTAPSPEDVFGTGDKIMTLKPFGAANHEDQWDIILQPEVELVGVRSMATSVINFTNRSISLFSQFRDGKLLIGIVKQGQAVG